MVTLVLLISLPVKPLARSIVLLTYLVKLIAHACGKGEKPQFEISIVALVVTALFLVYFLVPTKLN